MHVVGRTDEIAAIDDFVNDVADGASPGLWVLLILGAIGIGKTTLWEYARAQARARGVRVLSARPVEPETPLGFAALSDLFAALPSAVVDELPPPQRSALRVALLREDAGDDPPDPRSVATAALGVLRSLSRDGPVLLAVDDLPWLDAESARVLAFVLRRLTTESVALLGTVRTGPDATFAALPTDGVEPSRVRNVVPRALSIGAVRELLAERAGFAGTRRDLVRLHDASGGNPMFALELVRTFDGAEPDAQLRLPPTLRRLVHGRVTDLDPAVRDALLVTALCTSPTLDTVARACDPAAPERLALAAELGIVAIDGQGVAFTHPLLRSAVSGDATPEQRRAAHRRLAGAVSAPVELARHLALASETPDAEVALALEAAARDTHRQGAFDTAAELGELAVAMSPDLDDARLVAAARYRFAAGDPTRARELIGSVINRAEPGPQRSALLVQLATYERYSGLALTEWQQTLQAALADADDDVELQLAAHLDLGFAAFNRGDPGEGNLHIAACVDLVDRCTNDTLAAQVYAGVAWTSFVAGRGVDTASADQAVARYRPDPAVPAEIRPPYTLAMMCVHSGDLERARELLDAERAAIRDLGDESALVVVDWLLVGAEVWSGNWLRAEQLVAEGDRAAELTGMLAGQALMGGARTLLRAAQGRVDEARVDAARTIETAGRLGLVIPITLASEGIGQLCLALGDAQAAYDALAPGLEAMRAAAAAEPGVARGLMDLVEALIRLSRLDEAETLLGAFSARAVELDRGWCVVTALRCTALLRAARGELAAAETAADAAIERAATVGMPLETGRTLLIAAEIHRRARHKRLAQQRLREAQDCFDRLGAAQWSARCAAELDRTRAGAQSGALTEMEQRVADLAAGGHTSREIAAALFTSVRTVETHLQHVYAKLGVHSRVELSRRLTR